MKTEYKLENIKGLCIIHDNNNKILLDTSCPVSLSEVYSMGGFHFADDWLPLGANYGEYSLDLINQILRAKYDLDFRIVALIGNDTLSRYVITMDYPKKTITFDRVEDQLIGKYHNPEDYYKSIHII